jgi:hypothetical protein
LTGLPTRAIIKALAPFSAAYFSTFLANLTIFSGSIMACLFAWLPAHTGEQHSAVRIKIILP